MTPIIKVNGAIKENPLGLLPDDVWGGCRYGAEGLAGTVNREEFLALKKAEFAACIERLEEIGIPKIARSFSVMKDDMGTIRDREPFLEMMRRGTAYFLFEVESAVNPDFRQAWHG